MLAFPTTGQYLEEVQRNRAVMELISQYEKGGQLRKISAEDLTISDTQIQEKPCQSNDQHILSLALASKARILCSNDSNLRSDFKNKDLLPPLDGCPRILYPSKGSHKKRREFLNRQRCAHRQSN